MMTLEDFKKIMLGYDVSVQVYIMPQQAQWSRWLNGFVVNNTGNTNIIFGGDLIVPGQSKTFGGNYAEIYQGRLDFFFQLPSPAPPIPKNEIRITQKFYRFPE